MMDEQIDDQVRKVFELAKLTSLESKFKGETFEGLSSCDAEDLKEEFDISDENEREQILKAVKKLKDSGKFSIQGWMR